MDENSELRGFREGLRDALAFVGVAVPGDNGAHAPDEAKLGELLEKSGRLVRSITAHLNQNRYFRDGEDREMFVILTSARELAMYASGAIHHEQPEERAWCIQRLLEAHSSGAQKAQGNARDEKQVKPPKNASQQEQQPKRGLRSA